LETIATKISNDWKRPEGPDETKCAADDHRHADCHRGIRAVRRTMNRRFEPRPDHQRRADRKSVQADTVNFRSRLSAVPGAPRVSLRHHLARQSGGCSGCVLAGAEITKIATENAESTEGRGSLQHGPRTRL
jgi:hypothetical protein